MLDTAAEIHSPDAWENYLSAQPEWLKFTREEHAAARAIGERKPGWGGGWPVLSAIASFALVAGLIWMVL